MRRIVVLLAVSAVFAASCGGGDSSSNDSVADDDADSASTEPATTEAADFDIADVEQSVVKIVAEGTFIDPEVGEQRNSAGVGSGAIISEDGIVVTNNHVVTGAALLEVTVPGEDEPVNARILGVSECSDLAVIQLDGEGYTPLSYYDGEVKTGLEVYAAGFPASDAATIEEVDYTLTRGIISSTTASGETSWASVEAVLEHDARIRGGNSGGPLVDTQGRIVGVNYAGNDASDQNYAIAAADARDIIDELTAGNNVDSIGINGEAVNDGAGVSGIWVASVDSGSPADAAGIQPGDIITSLENIDLALDGTMSDYCDVIRTQGSDATMSVEVLRFATEEVYEGQLNGAPLELSFSFAQEFQDEVGTDDPAAAADTYAEFVTVSDDSGSITTNVPIEWSDVNGQPNPEFGPSLYAAPDIDSFLNTFDTPGVIIEATGERGAADIDLTLDELSFADQCTYIGRSPYADVLYTGSLDEYSDCGGTGTSLFVVAVTPEDGTFLARLVIQAVEPRDLDAADQIFASFVVSA
jgi:serine protease Do